MMHGQKNIKLFVYSLFNPTVNSSKLQSIQQKEN